MLLPNPVVKKICSHFSFLETTIMYYVYMPNVLNVLIFLSSYDWLYYYYVSYKLTTSFINQKTIVYQGIVVVESSNTSAVTWEN